MTMTEILLIAFFGPIVVLLGIGLAIVIITVLFIAACYLLARIMD